MPKALLQAGLSLLPCGETLNYLAQCAIGSHSVQANAEDLRNQINKLRELDTIFPIAGKRVVEIGTGWNGIGIICLHLMHAKELHTFDKERHMRWSLVRQMLETARTEPEHAKAVSGLLECPTLEACLKATHTHYHAPADASRTGLADSSVDLIFSYGVLEHIPVDELKALMDESARILAPGGIAFHRIGTHDHFQSIDTHLSAVNFVKYSNRMWRFLSQNRICYHNRLRAFEYERIFRAHGGRILLRRDEVNNADITASRTIRRAVYKDIAAEELAISHTDMVVAFQ